MKISLIAVLFGALALFAMPAFAQTAYPPGENVGAVLQGQAYEYSTLKPSDEIAIMAGGGLLSPYSKTAVLVEANATDRPIGEGRVYLGGSSCLTCTEPSHGLQLS